MSDLISRAEAKEALRERFKRIPTYAILAMHIIDELPTHTTPSNTLGVLDCVDREKVIEAIDDISIEIDEGYGFQYEKWRKYFCELPSIQPLKGKWLKAGTRMGIPLFECSLCECGDEVPTVMGKPSYNFCPNCGADMREGDEHHFLSRAVCDKWCLGKTYMIGDTLYRSGFPFKNDWKD